MSDRKHYSKRREDLIWRTVDGALVDLRIKILRGLLTSLNSQGEEEKIYQNTKDIAYKVCEAYRTRLDGK